MLNNWNNECSPPWSIDELIVKIDNAYRYAQKPQGADALPTEFTPVTIIEKPKAPIWLPQIDYSAFDNIPNREWVFGDIALKKKISLLVAQPGMGKSTWTLLVALSKASGRDIAGFNPRGIGVAAIHNQEDEISELYRRARALMMEHDISAKDIGDRLLLGSGEQRLFKIAKKNQNGLLSPSDMQSFTERLIETNVQLLIVDPFSETHDGEENSNVDVLQVGSMYRQMAQKANCAIIISHHSRKPGGASSEGFAGDMNTSRGASSLVGVARIVLTLESMSDKDATNFGIEKDRRNHYTRLDVAKANMSLASGQPLWYEKCSKVIDATAEDIDGEEVGTLRVANLEAKGYSLDSPIYKFICAIETTLEAKGPRLSIADIATNLIDEDLNYADAKPDTLRRRISRLFADSAKLPAARGELSASEVARQKGETLGKPRTFISWTPNIFN